MKFNKTSQEYKQINKEIRNEMRELKISQKALGEQLDIPQSGISDRLSGKTEWTLWEVLLAFQVLGLEFNYGKEKP